MKISRATLWTLTNGIATSIIAIALIDLGVIVWNQNKYISAITFIMAFISFYYAYYSFQIQTNTKDIEEIKKWKEEKEELLKSLKDIIILKKVSEIGAKK